MFTNWAAICLGGQKIPLAYMFTANFFYKKKEIIRGNIELRKERPYYGRGRKTLTGRKDYADGMSVWIFKQNPHIIPSAF